MRFRLDLRNSHLNINIIQHHNYKWLHKLTIIFTLQLVHFLEKRANEKKIAMCKSFGGAFAPNKYIHWLLISLMEIHTNYVKHTFEY